MAAHGSAQVPFWLPSNGLVAWYPFNNNANDASGNGNNGIVAGATLTTDRFNAANAAYSFNGSNNYISIKDTASLRVRKITLAAWIRPNTTSIMQLFSKSRITDAYYENFYMNTGLEFGFKYNSTCSAPVNDWRRFSYNTATVANTWQLVTSTYDGDSVRNYINGNLVSVARQVGMIDSCAGGNLRIGYNWNGDTYAFSGSMDDIAIYNRALSACEIAQIFNQNATKITVQPLDQVLAGQGSAQFSVTAPGTGVSYHWQQQTGSGFTDLNNGGSISGANSSTLIVSNANGMLNNNSVYRCIVSAPGLCADTSVAATLQLVTTAINGPSEHPELIISPNPANSIVSVRAGSNFAGKHFTLVNDIGQLQLSGIMGQAGAVLPVGGLAAGIYYFRVEQLAKAFKIVKY